MAVRASMAHEFNLVGNTLCHICDGYGHSHKVCPTNRKLKHLGKAGIAQTILKRVKESRKEARSRVNLGLMANWSFLPGSAGRKRNRMVVNSDISSLDTTFIRRPRLVSE